MSAEIKSSKHTVITHTQARGNEERIHLNNLDHNVTQNRSADI